jgi:phospholipid/cholesterol/gamma-HCH transport system substrate-binding protein
MEPDQKFATVGLFVLLSAAGLIVFTLWLSGRLNDQDTACYYMRFGNSVAGLSQGSVITFRGVSVGTVQGIRINPQDDTQILVRAALDKRTPIKPSTFAKLKPQGITGASYIELDIDPSVTDSNRESGKNGCRTIATKASGIEQIVNLLPQILDKALVVTDRLSNLLGDGNTANISETLANLRDTTAELRSATTNIGPQLTGATSNLNNALANINKLTASFNNGGSNVQDLQDTVRQAKAAIVEVRTLTEDIRTNPRRAFNTPTVKEEKVP